MYAEKFEKLQLILIRGRALLFARSKGVIQARKKVGRRFNAPFNDTFSGIRCEI